jgi:trigger factor
MQVSVEESGVIERKITISVPSEQIDQEVTRRLRDVAKKARIPGFRPGKAPESVIKKRYAPQVTNEVISETINSSYRDALGQEEIVPAGLVSIDPTPYEPGKDLEYVATVELFPEIPVATLEDREIEKPVVEITDEDVHNTLEDIRRRNANFVPKEEKSEKGDRVTIDFDGKIDGESFEGGTATDFPFVLGEGQMLEDFEAGITGAAVGDTKTVAFTFPENYGGGEVAGKDVKFEVTVKAVDQPELAGLDDSFAETLGIKEGGIEKMKEEIRTSLSRELAGRMRTVLRDSVMDALYASNEIEVPGALVEEEIDRAVNTVSEQLTAQNLPTDSIDRSVYAEDAKRRVVLGLIAREIIQKHEIQVDQSEVRSRIEEMATGYDDPEQFVKWHYAEPERLRQVESAVLEEQVVNRMLESANVQEKKLSFREFMNPGVAE